MKLNTKKVPHQRCADEELSKKWRRPTLPRVCSTIGAAGLNFSVRDGKRWSPGAVTTIKNMMTIGKERKSK